MQDFKKLQEAVIIANDEDAIEIVNALLSSGISANCILSDGLIKGMEEVGKLFAKREIFLPDVLISAKTMKLCVEILKPLLIMEDVKSAGKIVIGTVKGDLHDIGKNLVSIMLNGAGIEVIDLGHNVPSEKFIDAAIENNVKIIGLSALLTTTMPSMKEIIDLKKQRNLNDIKVIIGGAPVNEKFAKEIGADAYCYDAANAVEVVKNLLIN